MTKHLPMFALSLSMLVGLSLGPISQAQADVVSPGQAQTSSPVDLANAQRVHVEDGRFSVQVPVDLQTTPITTEIGGNRLTWTVAQARQGDAFYGVAYTDLSLEALGLGQEAIVEGLKSSPLASEIDWGAMANRGHRVSMGSLSGMEYLHLEGGQVSGVRFYLANRRLYAVMAAAPDLRNVSQFLESFAIDPLWQPFVSEPGGFRVDLPMAPVASPQQVIYQGTPLNWWQFVGYNLHAPDDRYGFAYADVPANVTASADTLLSEVATQVLTELEVPELATNGTAIALDGYPGRQYMITQASGQSSILRFYLVDDRLYGLLGTSRSIVYLDRFLNSFELL
jgi:hypothetical protein